MFFYVLENGRPGGNEREVLSVVEDTSIGSALKKALQPGAQSEMNEQQDGKEPSL